MNTLRLTPPVLNLEVYQGSTFYLPFQFRVKGTQIPIDITGENIVWSLAVTRGGRPAYTYGTEDGGVVITDGAQGKGYIRVPPRETHKWNARRYYHDLTVGDDVEEGRTYMQGAVQVSREVVVHG